MHAVDFTVLVRADVASDHRNRVSVCGSLVDKLFMLLKRALLLPEFVDARVIEPFVQGVQVVRTANLQSELFAQVGDQTRVDRCCCRRFRRSKRYVGRCGRILGQVRKRMDLGVSELGSVREELEEGRAR